MSKDFKLETIKAKYQIVKDKLLLFSAGFGSSLLIESTKNLNSFFEIVFGLGVVLSFIGLLTNLFLANRYLKEIERIEND
jgi:hypothetical protein